MFNRYPYQNVLTIIIFALGLIQAQVLADSPKSTSQEILNAILENEEVSHFTIEVSDSPYAVSVRGEVSTQKQKQTILDITKKLSGDKEIEDQIKVTADKFGVLEVSDTEIKNKINSLFTQEGIRTPMYEVNEGVVTISGNFRSFRELDYIFSLIQSTAGVKKIISKAEVNSRPYMQEFEGRGKDFNARQ